ncbi:hypothetical protein GEMRC1_012616 [Eukaryota sp. GEM-RC1]
MSCLSIDSLDCSKYKLHLSVRMCSSTSTTSHTMSSSCRLISLSPAWSVDDDDEMKSCNMGCCLLSASLCSFPCSSLYSFPFSSPGYLTAACSDTSMDTISSCRLISLSPAWSVDDDDEMKSCNMGCCLLLSVSLLISLLFFRVSYRRLLCHFNGHNVFLLSSDFALPCLVS